MRNPWIDCPGCGLAIDKNYIDSKFKEFQEREERKVCAEIEELFLWNSFLKLKEFPISGKEDWETNWDNGC